MAFGVVRGVAGSLLFQVSRRAAVEALEGGGRRGALVF